MKSLTTLLFAATLAMTSASAFAASQASDNNGQANASAEAGQQAPNNVDNGTINSGGTMLHPDADTSGGTMLHPDAGNSGASDMSSSEIHKNTLCKDGRCPDVNSKTPTGEGQDNNDADTRVDGTTQ
ncbi:protein YbgS [Entomohabitans teleogrylli]|uniref:protein YbgS n=1 Tax=Entomohabitans teleogrylli TaxID=1384589 RepID=UPI00073D31CD|nr:protein YbgS [Entomohabitans teleogrylli]